MCSPVFANYCWTPEGVQNTAINVSIWSVCLSVCISQKPHIQLQTSSNFSVCGLSVAVAAPLTTMQYVVYFHFCRWCCFTTAHFMAHHLYSYLAGGQHNNLRSRVCNDRPMRLAVGLMESVSGPNLPAPVAKLLSLFAMVSSVALMTTACIHILQTSTRWWTVHFVYHQQNHGVFKSEIELPLVLFVIFAYFFHVQINMQISSTWFY